jgi:hypothetical protein
MSMFQTLVSLLLGAVLLGAAAPGAAASAGSALLFAKDAGGLTAQQQEEIFAALGLKVAADGKSFVDTVCDQPAQANVTFSDWNGDGAQEVLAIYGNSCLSGFTGSSVTLFIRDAGGRYQPNLGFPGASADPKPTKNEGYPDLVIGGPGFCFPVWRWNGKQYVHHGQAAQEPGGCDQRP